MSDADRFRLLFGPYQAPPLKRGDGATCLFRDCAVVVTGWTDARIPWPRCRALDSTGGGSGLLVDEELARAVRHEAAVAIMHWWGVSRDAVQHWRRALGVGFSDSEGTVRLMRAAGWKSARAPHAKGLGHRFTPEEAERGSKNGGRARWQHRPGGHLALPKPRPGRKPGQTRGRPADEGRRAEVMRLRGKGLTLAEIGRRLGVTRQAVAIMLARAVADGAEGE